ncbi:MAG: hypothetical protein LHV69_07230 [Elusimicrobia bacterium]|nr:hypothetical protein [Candidatus Obscuribacterium magneticum]
MKAHRLWSLLVAVLFGFTFCGTSAAALRDKSSGEKSRGGSSESVESRQGSGEPSEVTSETYEQKGGVGSEDAPKLQDEETSLKEAEPPPAKKSKKKILSGSEGFVAGPGWEFEGFVSGGQDQNIKSMFVVNDLIYLNIGRVQGLESGHRVDIYKRGGRIRDPQSGRFIGYEVRHIGVAEITDQIDDETASARVIKTHEGIEIGDLVRKAK